jgi:hypothetical protein
MDDLPTNDQVRERLREWVNAGLERQGLSKTALADSIDVDPSRVTKLLDEHCNHETTFYQVMRIARSLGEPPPFETMGFPPTNPKLVEQGLFAGQPSRPGADVLDRIVREKRPKDWPVTVASRYPDLDEYARGVVAEALHDRDAEWAVVIDMLIAEVLSYPAK